MLAGPHRKNSWHQSEESQRRARAFQSTAQRYQRHSNCGEGGKVCPERFNVEMGHSGVSIFVLPDNVFSLRCPTCQHLPHGHSRAMPDRFSDRERRRNNQGIIFAYINSQLISRDPQHQALGRQGPGNPNE